MEGVIEVKDLLKQYPKTTALQGVSFSVPRGSVCGFLGPNGAGKTTTIRILLGLLHKTAGEATILGSRVSLNLPAEVRRRISYVPQDPVFPPGLSGREIMAFVGQVHGLGEGETKKRSGELLDRFELSQAADRLVKTYSRGMKQRLALAAAFLTEPELYILDEPVSALDPQGRFRVLELVASLRGQATVFFSSHILADVERVCDRVIMLNQGQVLADSSMDKLLKRYVTDRYLLRVKPGEEEGAADILRDKPWVHFLERKGEAILLTAPADGLDELRRQTLRVLVEANVTVYEFTMMKRDLESIFFDILTNEGKEQAHEHGTAE